MNIKAWPSFRKMLKLFLILHVIDFTVTTIAIHIIGSCFSERNIFIASIITSSPWKFALLFVLSTIYITAIFISLERLSRKIPVLNYLRFLALIVVIGKIIVVINNVLNMLIYFTRYG